MPGEVTLHVPLLGGGFGRRATNDYVMDAVYASREAGRPVKLIFTREDDMRSGYYRPMNANRLRGALDADGWPNAWIHNIVVQGIFGAFFAVEGSSTNYFYAMPNRRVTWRDPGVDVPVFTWRSVGASHNAFVVESCLDELAALGGKDPLELRLRLLGQSSDPNAARHAAALQDAADRAGWTSAPPAGRARGLAVHQTFGTIVAEVAEVSVEAGQVRVHKVWATVDCGRAVNPRGIEAQAEGGIIFGLSAALYGRIDLEAGVPTQGNFDTYRLLRMNEAPEIEVSIIESGAAITGMGEPAVPPIAPAVCNALYRLTGERIRSLPIQLPT
jgi:isoquinoline 1-oxidoreductase beta subunit